MKPTFAADSVDTNFGRVFERFSGIETRFTSVEDKLDRFYEELYNLINGQAGVVAGLREKLEQNTNRIITIEGAVMRSQEMEKRDSMFLKMISDKDTAFKEVLIQQNKDSKWFFAKAIALATAILGTLLPIIQHFSNK